MMDTPIPVVVVGGYLGAGKTTMIVRVLESAEEPVAVIVNDFGSVNIDAALVRRANADTIELDNGCVCCAIGTSLADTLFGILDRAEPPSMILIEASGVADPAAVAGFAHLKGLCPGGTIVLVDTVHGRDTAADRLVARTFERQVRAADVVVLTKSDDPTADPAATRELVRMLRPEVPVLAGSPDTLGELLIDPQNGPRSAERGDHDRFESETLDPRAFTDVDAVRRHLGSIGSMVRAKGVVEMDDGSRIMVQAVGRAVRTNETDLTPTGLVVIRSVPDRSGQSR